MLPLTRMIHVGWVKVAQVLGGSRKGNNVAN